MTSKNPTAANIISSLGVKGAVSGISSGGNAKDYAGFIPVLDDNGQLSVDFIPSTAVEQVVKPIYNVVVVDPNSQATVRTGSVVAPFKTIYEASDKFGRDGSGIGVDDSKRCAIILMPGIYKGNNNSRAQFHVSPSQVFFIGLGECKLDATMFTVAGVANASVFFQNIVTSNNITVQGATMVTCLGRTYIGGNLNVGTGAVKLSDESRVTSTDATNVTYLSEASHIGNTSSVKGGTVENALDRLDARKLRLSKIKYGSSGFSIGSSTDVSASSFGSFDGYDLRERDKTLVDGLNDIIEKNKNLVAATVTAGKIKAQVVETTELKMSALTLGGYKLSIDYQGYLVVLDGDSPITPPKGVILIEDTGSSMSGEVYAITAVNGRLFIGDADAEYSSSSSSSDEILQAFTVIDAITGYEYTVRVDNGRMVIEATGSVVESDEYAPKLYAIDETTNKYHQIVAVTNAESGKVTLKVKQNGIDAGTMSVKKL